VPSNTTYLELLVQICSRMQISKQRIRLFILSMYHVETYSFEEVEPAHYPIVVSTNKKVRKGAKLLSSPTFYLSIRDSDEPILQEFTPKEQAARD
jgi:hypothetical protein